LGDPAVKLPVAKEGEKPAERIGLEKVTLKSKPAAEKMEKAKSPDDQPAEEATLEGEKKKKTKPASMALSAETEAPAGGPVSIQVMPDGTVNIVISPQAAGAMAEAPQAKDFAGIGLFRRKEGDAAEGKEGPFDNVVKSIQGGLQSLGQKIQSSANDLSSLDVQTYTSESMESVKIEGDEVSGAVRRAWTYIDLDGDTKLVVPMTDGEVDTALWEIHARAVSQAQEFRAAMLKAIMEFISGLLPGK
jgi:hypothetical protein